MTLIRRSWIVQLFLSIALSSVKVQKITQNNINSAPHVFSFQASFAGANAMAMQVSMQLPMKVPPFDFSGFGAPVNNPRRVFISSLPGGGPFGPAIPLPFAPQRNINGQQPVRPQICQCGKQHNIPTNQVPPPQYNPPQQQLQCCQNAFQPPPQPQCCQNHVPTPQQPPCCQNHFEPPQQQPPCCHNQFPIQPGHGQNPFPHPGQNPFPHPGQNHFPHPGQNHFPLPGQNTVPVAQVVLTPNVGRCSSDESDDSDDESNSEETEGCARRCHEKVSRMRTERRNSYKKHRRMNGIKRHSVSRRRFENHGEPKVKPLRPVLQYVTKNGNVKYKTKISNDAALDLFGDYFVEPTKHKQLNARRVFNFDEGSNSPAKVRVVRAGNPSNFNDVNQQHLLLTDKTQAFDLRKQNDITNLSLTFLFS